MAKKKTTKNVFKIGDMVMVEAREPMPKSMELELLNPQKITVVYADTYFEFESGWSANTAMGDKVKKVAKKKTTKLEDIEREIDSYKSTKKVIKNNEWEAFWDDKVTYKDDEEIEIPHLRGGDWKWNFEKKPMTLTDKITWVLTAMNVAILITLLIKNLN